MHGRAPCAWNHILAGEILRIHLIAQEGVTRIAIESAWSGEIESRVAAFDRGEVPAYPAEVAYYNDKESGLGARFVVVYRPGPEGVVIFAVAHCSRRPAHWQSRVQER